MRLNTIQQLLALILVLGLISCGNSQQTSEAEEPLAETSNMTTPASFGGLALYTLRDTLAKDPKGILKEVAANGYKYIEAANYEDGKFYGMAPAEFKTYLDSIGLTPMSAHMGGVTLDNADQQIADVKAAGFKYFVIPVPQMGHFKFDPKTRTLSMSEDLKTVMDIINTIAEKCTAAGLGCLYHNHDFEFKKNSKGIVPIDYFIEHSDPQHLNFQMDLYWVTKAEEDPIEWFKKIPGRVKSWHVKDMDAEGRFAPVGTGSIDFAKILAEKDLSGMECYFVEQDMAFDQTPLEAIKISHDGLAKIGFN